MSIQGWHFCNDWRLRDGTPLEIGRSYHVDPPLVQYKHGLHAGTRIIDIIDTAPGAILCKVELSGQVIQNGTDIIATDRKVLEAINAFQSLHLFACSLAKQSLLLTGIDEDLCWNALETKQAWMLGETDDEALIPAIRSIEQVASKYAITRTAAEEDIIKETLFSLVAALNCDPLTAAWETAVAARHVAWDAVWIVGKEDNKSRDPNEDLALWEAIDKSILSDQNHLLETFIEEALSK